MLLHAHDVAHARCCMRTMVRMSDVAHAEQCGTFLIADVRNANTHQAEKRMRTHSLNSDATAKNSDVKRGA